MKSRSGSLVAPVFLTLLALVSGDILSKIRRRPWDFENAGREAVYVKSIAVNGHIAGNSVSVTFHDPEDELDPREEGWYQQRGRRKRGEDEENAKAVAKSTEKFQKDEAESGPSKVFLGVVGFHAELECDVQPENPDDQLQLILWYKEGHASPIYSFDVREKSMLSYASHFSSESVFGQRAQMRINSEGTKAILAVEHLLIEDEGIYKCRTDFKRSPTKNSKMSLSIIIPPKKPMIHDSNGRKMVEKLGPFKVGDDLSATCITVGGKPPPRLTWWREHALLDDSFEIVNGRTTNTFTLTNIRRQDLGTTFTCQAVNNNQSAPVATTLKLDLTFPPVSATISGDRRRSLTSGKEEQLECVCRGSRPAPIFHWFIGGRELDTTHEHLTVSYDSESLSATAIIRFIPLPEDNGKYMACRAVNEYFPSEPKEDGYIVNVNFVPISLIVFGRSLNPKNIREGDDVYFECHVKSNPPFFNITWRQNGKFLVENVSDGIIIGNQTLVLQKIRREDAGLYTCVASNQEGDGESNAQYLNVKFAPTCRDGQRITYGTARKSDTEVVCRVDANPTPHHFRWQFKTARQQKGLVTDNLLNGHNSEDAIDNVKDMVDLPANRYSIEHDHSVLKYRVMTEADYGFLFCWGENAVGEQTLPCRYEIVKESAPDPVQGCFAVNVTWERIHVECRAGFDGGHPPTFILEAFIVSNPDGDLPRLNSLVYNITTNEIPPRFDLAGLTSGTEYKFLVYSANSLGTSAKVSLNATTMNLAEKRTAETRSKIATLNDQEMDLSRARGGVDALEAADVDRELALLPIVAILCGVAVGLGTVALGVILLVRGRTHEEDSEGGDNRRQDESSLGGGRYDTVCASPKVDDELCDQASIQIRPGSKGERFTTLPRATQTSLSRLDTHCGSLQRSGYPMIQGDDQSLCGQSRASTFNRRCQIPAQGGASQPLLPTGLRNAQDDQRFRPHLTTTTGSPVPNTSRQGTLQRNVHFETPTLDCEETSIPLMSSPSSTGSSSCVVRHVHHVNFMDTVSEVEDPLPAPPTFCDPPVIARVPVTTNNPIKGFAVGQQLLRVNAPPSGNQAGIRELESSFVTFCSPNLETKARDIVNATRL